MSLYLVSVLQLISSRTRLDRLRTVHKTACYLASVLEQLALLFWSMTLDF
jgi:hypothetical protein